MIPEPYELFDIDKTPDKLFLIGTSWVVLFLMLLWSQKITRFSDAFDEAISAEMALLWREVGPIIPSIKYFSQPCECPSATCR